MMKYTRGWKCNRKYHPFYGKSMGANIPGLSHSMSFTDFSDIMINLMRKPTRFACDEVYHKIEIQWKKPHILWEKYEYQFPKFSTFDGFCGILPATNFPGSPH